MSNGVSDDGSTLGHDVKGQDGFQALETAIEQGAALRHEGRGIEAAALVRDAFIEASGVKGCLGGVDGTETTPGCPGPGDLGITPGPTRQIGGSQAPVGSSSLETGGFDWLEGALYGAWEKEGWPRLVQELDQLRGRSEREEHRARLVTSEGDRLYVAGSGSRHGGVYCRWVLQWQGLKFHIVNRQTYHESRASIFYDAGSLPCMLLGGGGVWFDVQRIVKLLGFDLVRDVVSRVDLCADLAGIECVSFVDSVLGKRCVKRGRKTSLYKEGARWEGCKVGTDIQVRIYDKTSSLLGPGPGGVNARKSLYLRSRRWPPDTDLATRVEFQLRRTALREQFDVEGVDDLFEKVAAIAQWLTHEWFRITDDVVDEQNTQRFGPSALWQTVIDHFAAWTGPVRVIGVPRGKGTPDLKRLEQQLMGIAETILAERGELPRTEGEFVAAVSRIVRQGAKRSLLRVVFKRLDIESDVPTAVVVREEDIPY
jgi:hypothetical protein